MFFVLSIPFSRSHCRGGSTFLILPRQLSTTGQNHTSHLRRTTHVPTTRNAITKNAPMNRPQFGVKGRTPWVVLNIEEVKRSGKKTYTPGKKGCQFCFPSTQVLERTHNGDKSDTIHTGGTVLLNQSSVVIC